jgi:hypothetical protein
MTANKSSNMRSFTILAAILAILSGVYYFLESNLDSFYIFSPPELHDLSLRAIGAHGNDTRAVVSYIVSELSEKLPGGYVNLDEEWIFNNAGGAMGAMYIIHASELQLSSNTSHDMLITLQASRNISSSSVGAKLLSQINCVKGGFQLTRS